MKGLQGIALAVGLGFAGAILNFFYIQSRANRGAQVEFLAIKDNVRVRRGDTFKDEQLEAIPLPGDVADHLADKVARVADLPTIVGMKAVRDYSGGEFLLYDDLKTPTPEYTLAAHQRALGIPVDPQTFVPSLVQPGDQVSFLLSSGAYRAARADGEGGTPAPQASPADETEIIGPFEVLSIGNRLGRLDVMQASGAPQEQAYLITIRVEWEGDAKGEGHLSGKAQKLLDRLRQGGFRPVEVMLHPRTP